MIYDISQPVFECKMYPGDPGPERKILSRLEKGDECNLTAFSMCAHNGTHVDAPFHFYNDGKRIDEVCLEWFIGPAFVTSHEGDVTAADASRILKMAAAVHSEKKILLKGNATVTLEAAKVFAEAGIQLIGNESQTVGPLEAPAAVHRLLLKAEVVLLEGIRLTAVPDGTYILNCAPLNLNGADGAPCRAVLIDTNC